MKIELTVSLDVVNTVLKALEATSVGVSNAHKVILEQAQEQINYANEQAENAGGTD